MMSPILAFSISLICAFGLIGILAAVAVLWRKNSVSSLRNAERLLGLASFVGVGGLADAHFAHYLSYGGFLMCEFAGFMLYLAARRYLYLRRRSVYDREFARILSL